MPVTHFKRIANLDIRKTQADAIEELTKSLRIKRAELLRRMIDVALRHQEELKQRTIFDND